MNLRSFLIQCDFNFVCVVARCRFSSLTNEWTCNLPKWSFTSNPVSNTRDILLTNPVFSFTDKNATRTINVAPPKQSPNATKPLKRRGVLRNFVVDENNYHFQTCEVFVRRILLCQKFIKSRKHRGLFAAMFPLRLALEALINWRPGRKK